MLDVPRTSPAVLDALESVGTIVLVINQELSTVRSAARLSSALQARYGRDRLQLIVNRFDERAEISQRDVERVTGLPVKHMLPNHYAVGGGLADRGTAGGARRRIEAERVAQDIYARPGRAPGARKPRAVGAVRPDRPSGDGQGLSLKR